MVSAPGSGAPTVEVDVRDDATQIATTSQTQVAGVVLAIEAAVLVLLALTVAGTAVFGSGADRAMWGPAGLSLLVALLALGPLALAWRADQVDLTEPAVFAGWAVWFPAFGLGGVALAMKWNQPYYLVLVADPGRMLMVAEAWGAVGFVAFVAGVRAVRRAPVGPWIGRLLPSGALGRGRRTSITLWAIVAVGAGLILAAVATGRMGYDTSGTGSSSAVVSYVAVLLPLGSGLLWYRVLLDPDGSRRARWITGAVLLGVNGVCALAIGSRASLATVIGTAILLALHARPGAGHRAMGWSFAAVGVALLVGVLVVSSYREIRYQRVVGAQQAGTVVPEGGQAGDLAEALGNIRDRGVFGNIAYTRDKFVERLELPASVGIVAVRYPTLREAEDEAGTRGDVEAGVVGAFIPRAVWSSKPATMDPNAYGRVYFEFDNAFAMSPMGDVLRDIGPVAVPLAMVLMGALVGTTHAALRGRGLLPDRVNPGRTVLWIVLAVRSLGWFEGQYATFLADLVRVGIIGIVVLFVVGLSAGRPGIEAEGSTT